MPKPTHKRAIELISGDRIQFFRGETSTFQTGQRNDSLSDTVRCVEIRAGNMVKITTVSDHVLERHGNCPFRLAAEEKPDSRPLAAKPQAQTVRGVSIE